MERHEQMAMMTMNEHETKATAAPVAHDWGYPGNRPWHLPGGALLKRSRAWRRSPTGSNGRLTCREALRLSPPG